MNLQGCEFGNFIYGSEETLLWLSTKESLLAGILVSGQDGTLEI